MAVLELLAGEEPGGDGGHRHADHGHGVRGDKVRDPGVGHRQVGERLVKILKLNYVYFIKVFIVFCVS